MNRPLKETRPIQKIYVTTATLAALQNAGHWNIANTVCYDRCDQASVSVWDDADAAIVAECAR